ncbi:MAG TPA: hypothetical protein VME66_02440 [Candidatus Acidoferrales bacterium]|nr:hypothetical protein [Candidatus Acidoferrales bacterium]
MIQTIEIGLTIPDNEAYTALTTLQRLGVEIGGLRRADLWRFELAASAAESFVDHVRTLETIYNPNKHTLRVRHDERPACGEVWIDEPGHGVLESPVRISGRVLPGVERAARSVSWHLQAPEGGPASAEVVRRAVEILLCNPAFQKATI